jgi:O-methyltransferase/aklanonic acid methyltransferase
MAEPTVATKKMIEELFDGAAAEYDRTGPSLFTEFGARLVERLPLETGARVLDVATGKGAVLLPAARRVGPDGHVTGVDLSAPMLDEAARAARDAGLANVDLLKMDAERLDFPDQSFDVVVCAFALFLLPDMDAGLRELCRVVKPGGVIGVSTFGTTPPLCAPAFPILMQQFEAYQGSVRMPRPIAFAPRELEALLARFGLRSIEAHGETSEVVYASAEEWWAFLLTLGPRPTILGMDEETRTRFKDEYFAKVRPLLRPDGLHLPVAVVYATARR